MSRIFISYKRVDKEKVFKIKDQIESVLGEKCWIDLDGIESDAQFVNVIIKAIDNAEIVLFMYSRSHTQIADYENDWTIRELSYSNTEKKRIVFINIDGSPLTKWFKFMYNQKQQVDGQSQESLSRLLKDLALWLGHSECPSPSDHCDTNNPPEILQFTKRFGRNVSRIAKGLVDSVKNVDPKYIEEGRQLISSYKENSDSTALEDDRIHIGFGDIRFDMIRVEGGSLKIGATTEQLDDADNNEYPEHNITLPTYYISEFPITQNLWEAVMGYNKSKFRTRELKSTQNSLSGAIKGAVAGIPFGPVGMAAGAIYGNKHLKGTDIKGHYPTENLSHDEALEFVRRLSNMTRLNFSLPTEQEWEYAARGGQKSKGYKYAGSNDIDEVAWNKNNSDGHTHPVGEKQPNELGLYDMSGNVWEWTETPAHTYSDNDSIHNGDVFVRRGGSWWHEPINCRVSKRYASDKSKKTSGLGLRVVMRLD